MKTISNQKQKSGIQGLNSNLEARSNTTAMFLTAIIALPRFHFHVLCFFETPVTINYA
jgi:hypothetical protein